MTRAARYTVWALLGLVGLLLVLAASAVAGRFWLASDTGRAWLTAQIENAASSETMTMTIGALDGDPFTRFTVRNLDVGDAAGSWLTIDETRVEWRPWALLDRTLDVATLSVSGTRLARLPEGGESTDEGGGLPQLPLAVRVRDFDFADIRLEEPVAGMAAVLAAEGEITATAEAGYILRARARRMDTVEAGLDADIRYRPDTDMLDAAVTFEAPAGGVFSGLVGLPGQPAIDLALTGSGRLDDWQGNLQLDIGGRETAALDLAMTRPADVRLAVDGRVDPRTVADLPVFAAAYDLTGRFRFAGSAVTVESFRLDGPPARLRAFGTVETDPPVLDLLFQFDPKDMAAVNALMTPVALGATSVEGRVSGPVSSPALSLNVTTDSFSVDTIRANNVFLAATARMEEAGITVTGTGGMDDLEMDETVVAGPTLGFDLTVPADFSRLDVGRATMTAYDGRISAQGRVPFTGMAGMRLNLDLDVPAKAREGGFLATMAAAGARGSALLVQETESTPLRLSDIQLDHPWVAATGNVRLGEGDDPLADLEATFRRLDLLAAAAGLDAAGDSVAAEARVRGSWAAPQIDLGVDAARLDVSGVSLTTLRADMTAAQSEGGDREGHIDFSADTRLGPAAVATDFNLPADGPLTIANLTIKGEPGTLAGGFTGPMGDGAVTGGVSGTLTAEKGLAKRLDLPLQGELALDLALAGADTAQTVELSLAGKDAFFGLARLDSAAVRAEIADGTTEFTADLAGYYRGDASLDLAGSVSPESGGTAVALSRLRGQIGPHAVALTEAFRLRTAEGRIIIDPVTLSVGDGMASLAVDQGADRFAADAEFTDIPLDIIDLLNLPLGVAGQVSGQLDFMAEAGNAAGTLRVDFHNVNLVGGTAQIDGLNGALTGKWDGRRLGLSADLESQGEDTIVLAGDIPLAYGDGGIAVPGDASLDVTLNWTGEIAPLWQALELEADLLSGRTIADIRVAGTPAAPEVSGMVELSDGVYRNIDAGTVLRDVNARIAVQPDRAEIETLTATDGRGGTASATGSVRFPADSPLSADIDLEFDNLRAVNRPEATARVTGTIQYAMTDGRARVTGDIRTEETEVRLVSEMTGEVVALDVVEVPAPRGDVAVQPASEAAAPPPELDIAISMPRRLFIRGQGLDSEWEGNLNVEGPSDAFRLRGTVNLVRGTFEFLGKRFQLIEGQVRFIGNRPIDPELNIVAEHQTASITARVAITGTAQDIAMDLSSSPALPEDEIMSRVLFGTSATDLSALEAVQLAWALRQLSQGGGVGGVIGTTRQALGLDVLSIGSGENGGGTVVRGGKYITENIYIEVQSGTEPGSEKVGVEVQVTPRISVESEFKQDTGGDIGVYWKRNY